MPIVITLNGFYCTYIYQAEDYEANDDADTTHCFACIREVLEVVKLNMDFLHLD